MNTVYSFAEKKPANTIVLITGSSGTGNPYPLLPVIRLRLNQKLNTNNNSLIRLWSENMYHIPRLLKMLSKSVLSCLLETFLSTQLLQKQCCQWQVRYSSFKPTLFRKKKQNIIYITFKVLQFTFSVTNSCFVYFRRWWRFVMFQIKIQTVKQKLVLRLKIFLFSN